MARIFRYIFNNLFFAGKRVLFQHKDSDAMMKEDYGGKIGKTLDDLRKEEKKKLELKEVKTSPSPIIKPYGKIRTFFTKLAYQVLRLIVTSSVKITIEGREHIPQVGDALIVANHSSYLDVPVIGVAFFDNLIDLSWVVSKSNYKTPFLRWLYLIFKPIVTGGGTIDKIKYDLNNNRWVVLFPEGNERWCPPSEAKKKEKPYSGAAVVALSTGVTIIPVGITGADKVLPARSFKMDTRYHITIRIGQPFSYTKINSDTIDTLLISQTREEIMNRVYTLVDYQGKDIEVEDKKAHKLAGIAIAIKKAIMAIIVSGIAVNISSSLMYHFFHSVYSIGTGSVMYRPYMFSLNTEGASLLGGLNFINCVIFVIGYAILYNAIPSKGIKKGLIFSLFIWLLGIVVPVLRVYMAVSMALPVFIYWLTIDLVGYLVMGVITGAIYKDRRE